MQFTLAIQAIRDMKMRVRRKWNDGFFGKMGLSEGDSGYSMYKRMMEEADEQTRELDEVEKFLLELQQNKDLLPQLQQAPVMLSLQDFKARRLKLGLTLRDVEERTGISNAYLSQLENGKIKKPSFEVVQKLNSVYACNAT